MAVQTNTNNLSKTQSMGKFFKNVRSELKKVIWPSRKDLTTYTTVVLVACVFAALGIWAVDALFGGLLKLIIK